MPLNKKNILRKIIIVLNFFHLPKTDFFVGETSLPPENPE